jgi:hypothetical protein
MLRALARAAKAIRQLSLFDPDPPAPPEAPAPEEVRARVPPPSEALRILPPEPAAPPSPASFAALCTGPYAHVTVELATRLRDSWRVTWTRRHEGLLLRLPSALGEAPEEIKRAALRWAVLVSKRSRKPDPLLKIERRALEEALRDHLKAAADHGPRRKRRLAANGRRLDRLNPRGRSHDLETILAAINAEYFGGALEARITWASRLGGLSTHRLAEDDQGRPYHLLTISRGYDCPEVTPEILGGVVYHECLHIAVPPRKEGGRRVVHGRDFRLRERQYRFYREWMEWHRHGLPKALRRMMREGKRSGL